jgi:hypothetical protein
MAASDASIVNFNYFAIGSMINPTSLANRGIKPLFSAPAELLNHRLGFFTALGVAEPIPDEGGSLHGVIHTLTPEAMKALDATEQSLHARILATARLYDGREIDVTVYSRNEESRDCVINKPPSERYIEIMILGCRHFEVDPKYIEYLQNVEKVPRPSPESYHSLGSPESKNLVMTLDKVLEHNGLDGKPLYFCINRKVIEVNFEPDSKEFLELRNVFHQMGQVGDLFMSRIAYDPMFGSPERLVDVTPEHAAYLENNLCEYLKMKGFLDKMKAIAWLEVKMD